MAAEYSWERMLEEFRALGGTADNVVQRPGPHGNGLFAVDPARPVRLHAPERLLVDVKSVLRDGDDLIIDPAADVPTQLRAFFARYQRRFSWGAAGRSDAEALETSLRAWPEPLLKRLKELALVDVELRHKGEWSEVITTSFLNSRRIIVGERDVLMPVVELVNHNWASPGFRIDGGVTVEGTFAGEVTVNYSISDPLRRFLAYGFVSREPVAFSLPMRLRVRNDLLLMIGNQINDFTKEGKMVVPKVEIRGETRRLSHLRIGSEGAPRMPKTILRKALTDVPSALADEAFERVRSANIGLLCELLELADGAESCAALRRALLAQLRAVSYCFGVRTDAA